MQYTLGPGFQVTLQHVLNGGSIGVYVCPPTGYSNQPISAAISFTATSFSGQQYKASSFCYMWEKDIARKRRGYNGRGYTKFLCSEDWKLWKELRADDGFVLDVVVRSPPASTVRSPAILDALHKVIEGQDASDITFTLFRHRLRSGELQGCQTIHAEIAVLKDTCEVLNEGERATHRLVRMRSSISIELVLLC